MVKYLFFLFIYIGVCASEKKTICLNMIVKDESAVIRRSLNSVKPLIDYWVIVDTGSTDGTQQMIRDTLQGIPGELHERPWVNFEHNRNEALDLAKKKADYAFFIDADEELIYTKEFKKPQLDQKLYYILVSENGFQWQREALVDLSLNCRWKGVLHEALDFPQRSLLTKDVGFLQGVTNYPHTNERARSKDADKYQKDLAILEAALEKEPDNARYVFYLGQTYYALEDYRQALKAYEKRTLMGGWDQEVYWSLYLAGQLKELFGASSQEAVQNYCAMYKYRPSRAESLYRLADHYERTGNPVLGYIVSNFALSIPLPEDRVMVEKWIYQYGIRLVCMRCAHALNWNEETAKQARILISQQETLPLPIRNEIRKHLKTSQEKNNF